MRNNKDIKERNYSRIFIGSNSLGRLDNFLSQKEYSASQIFILTDTNTLKYCFPFTADYSFSERAVVIEIPAGEGSKEIELCKALWSSLNFYGADRTSVLVNLGGGVVSDIGGFVASTFKRGIRYINIPTSLLAMTDASLGGKTGIDMAGIKNLVGTFQQPEAVFVFPDFLKTLPHRQLLSGYAEMLKHALIADPELWKTLKKQHPAKISNWTSLIRKSMEVKNAVVEADPFEHDLRKILNFGHTVGHAVESASLDNPKTSLLHGEAVAIGMICESYISYKSMGLSDERLDEICTALLSLTQWKPLPASHTELILLMRSDKKNRNNVFQFTLISEIGQVNIDRNCPEELIAESLAFYESLKN